MDPIQVTIIGISITLTVLVVFLGVQVWYILKEFRLSIQKMNKMLDDAGKVTGTVSGGVESMGGFLGGIKAGASLISSFRKKGDHHE